MSSIPPRSFPPRLTTDPIPKSEGGTTEKAGTTAPQTVSALSPPGAAPNSTEATPQSPPHAEDSFERVSNPATPKNRRRGRAFRVSLAQQGGRTIHSSIATKALNGLQNFKTPPVKEGLVKEEKPDYAAHSPTPRLTTDPINLPKEEALEKFDRDSWGSPNPSRREAPHNTPPVRGEGSSPPVKEKEPDYAAPIDVIRDNKEFLEKFLPPKEQKTALKDPPTHPTQTTPSSSEVRDEGSLYTKLRNIREDKDYQRLQRQRLQEK